MASNMSEASQEAQRWHLETIRRLKRALRERRLVVLVGAGVTLNATSDNSGRPLNRLTWKGLIRNGLDFLNQGNHVQNPYPRKRRAYEFLEEDDPEALLDAADALTNQMRRCGQYPTWLEFVFGNLFNEVRHPAVLEALRALHQSGATLLTTNFDDLLERFCGINSVNRSDKDKFLRFKRGDLDGVLHVHGIYHEPDEVVLDRTNYYQAKHSDEIQNLLKEFLDSRTILFVGCGSGLEDPNFGPLLDWAKDRQRNIPKRHCLLVRNDNDFNPRFLLPVSYGPEYEDLADCLKQLLDQPDQTADDHRNSLKSLTAEEQTCLHALYPLGMKYEDQKNQNPRRVQNTCVWALSRPNYIQWRDGHAPQLLWVSADAGCGKSVLSRTIVDEDLTQFRKRGGTVLYYFFKDTSEDQRSVPRAIASLLHQLFESKPMLLRYALPKFRHRGNAMMSSLTGLWAILTEALASSIAGNVACVLDALDECDDEQGRQLMTLIHTLFAEHNAINLRILITSRPYLSLQAAFAPLLENGLSISIKGTDESDEIKKEIDMVIKYQVADFAKHRVISEVNQGFLESKLLNMQQRTYLWLRLVWSLIREHFPDNEEELEEIITGLPDGIMETYEKLLSRCRDQRFARKVLQTVLVAMRPLTLEEMDVILHINSSSTSLSQLPLTGSLRLKDTLPGKCGNMITVIDSKVYFIHQTVKDFLLGGRNEFNVSKQHINPIESHLFLTVACTRRLLFADVDRSSVQLGNALAPLRIRKIHEFDYGHVFLAYAAAFWVDHYREVPRDDNLVRDMCDESRLIRSRFGDVLGNFLTVAALGGHKSIVELLVRSGVDVNAQEKEAKYTNALQAACSGDKVKIVQMLIDRGVHLNAPAGYRTPLQEAFFEDIEQIVRLLIDHGADVNAQGEDGTALHEARKRSHVQIVRLLLDRGADVNARGEEGTALHEACYEGNEQIVGLLIDRGADVDAPGEIGTALEIASRLGHEQIVQILLDSGAADTRSDQEQESPSPLNTQGDEEYDEPSPSSLDFESSDHGSPTDHDATQTRRHSTDR